MCEVYSKRVETVEAVRFDGTNGDAVVEFVGGADYGVVAGDTVILSPSGKDPRGGKVTVSAGQFVAKPKSGPVTVVNEGDFLGSFEIVEGEPPPPIVRKLPDPVPEDELVYQPGFGPLTEEDKKKAEEKAAADKKKAEEKAAADKKLAAPHKPEPVGHHR
jgi:hypothetical protein